MIYRFFNGIYKSIHSLSLKTYDIRHTTLFQITHTKYFPEPFTNSQTKLDSVKIARKTGQRFTGVKKIPPIFTTCCESIFLFGNPTKHWLCMKRGTGHSQFFACTHNKKFYEKNCELHQKKFYPTYKLLKILNSQVFVNS